MRGYALVPQANQFVPPIPQIVEVREEPHHPQDLDHISLKDWIKLLDRFMKLKSPIFSGETDGVTVVHYMEGVRCCTLSLGAD